uniref:Protein RER1 n=1 Tax=Podarcis muralis TaxID=64176 RepID=A0A670IEZ5_PODMU
MSEGDSTGESIHGKSSVVFRFFTRLGQIYQSWLDKSTPYTAVRWVATLGLSFIYMIRVYLLQMLLDCSSHHLLASTTLTRVDGRWSSTTSGGPDYCNSICTWERVPSNSIGLVHRDICLGHLPPKPFHSFLVAKGRSLSNGGLRHSATKGILVAMTCTFFEAFNVPVFWPILVMYFIMLFCITMKRQIKHMIKYRYIPFTHGKRKYKGKEDVGKTFAS